MNLLKGRHIKPRDTLEFHKVCGELQKDFTGAMRLMSKMHGHILQADVIIKEGSVVAASLEDLTAGKVVGGDPALEGIRTRLANTRGHLDVYEISENDINQTIMDNQRTLLKNPVRIHELSIKIEPKIERKSPLTKLSEMIKALIPRRRPERVRDKPRTRERIDDSWETRPGSEAGIDYSEHARRDAPTPTRVRPPPTSKTVVRPPGAHTGEGIQIPSVSGLAKSEHLAEIKQRRMQRIARKIITEKGGKKPVKTIKEGTKVETKIDKLYDLVNHEGEVKVNDGLATVLGTPKTQIEEWAMILEEHDLVELDYPAIGEPIIKAVKSNK